MLLLKYNKFILRKCITIISLFALLTNSCSDQTEFPHESNYKKAIIIYLQNLERTNSSEEERGYIKSLLNGINFSRVEVYNLRTTEQMIVADVKSLQGFRTSNELKALFFVNQEKIVRSNIVELEGSTKFDDTDKVILSIVNMQPEYYNYTGKISFYSVFQKLLLFDVLENGELKINGVAHKGRSKATGKTSTCTHWFLITTEYYSWGTQTTVTYLYTTCNCGGDGGGEEESSRLNCEGGNGGTSSGTTSGPVFPANPNNNDEYAYTSSLGEYTRYKFDSSRNIWVVIERILPPLIVETEPENYPFLQIEWPIHNQTVFGSDYIIYHYDGFSGNWLGLYCIQNQLTTPCLSNTADHVLNPNLVSTYNSLIQSIFNANEDINWILKEQSYIEGNAQTPPIACSGSTMNITTFLDPSDLANKPTEFIATTILHEAMHAILHYYYGENTTPTQQHITMLTSYIDQIADAIVAAYPGVPKDDAKGLLLSEVFSLNPIAKNAILTEAQMTEAQITNIYIQYNNGTKGTPCN